MTDMWPLRPGEKSPPLRATRQRLAVLRVMAADSEFRTVAQWHQAVSDAGESVGLTTVYRTLAALAEAGLVDVVVAEDGESRYRRCNSGHHHHLICRRCGATTEIDAMEIEATTNTMAARYGFSAVSHILEIFGDCPTCQQAT